MAILKLFQGFWLCQKYICRRSWRGSYCWEQKIQQATETFFDPFLVVIDASRNYEERDAVIGLDKRWNLLYVVYVESESDVIRIISARKATRKEREYYEE